MMILMETLLLFVAGSVLAAAIPGEASEPADPLDACNVVWDSPSADSKESMPIGNGDIGLNVWVEPSGDLVFYISKTDAWDENGRVCKIGRVRVTFDPPLPATTGFRQELKLREGVIEIRGKLSVISNQLSVAGNQAAGGTTPTSATDDRSLNADGFFLRLWVDANQPVVRLETESATPVNCRAAVELWRLRERPFGPSDDSHSGGGLAASDFKPTVLPDVVVDSGKPRAVWYHRNTRSIYELGLKVQHLETLKGRFADPLLNRTFGASLRGDGFVADGSKAIKSAAPAKRHALSVAVLTAQTDTPEEWLAQLDQLDTRTGKLDPAMARRAHETWWREFWNRSWIFVDGAHSLALPVNAHPWRVGGASDGGSRFGGAITGPRVLGRALSAAEIAQLAGKEPAAETKLGEEALQTGCTVAAWIKPAAGETGRILDKCTAGLPDGFTLDAHPRLSLRWIVGEHTMIQPNCLRAGEWQHVAATVDAGTGVRRLYLNGKLVMEEQGDLTAEIVTRGYVLQRFMNACSGRGGLPIKFNGSIFTVEATPGASAETPEGDPDWRQWGGAYWFQNTRLAYWPMLAAGDFEMMQPWFQMYRAALPLSQARIQTCYKFANAAQFPETMYWWGLPCNGDYGWNNQAPEPANSYISRYWNGSLELIAAMLERYDYTQDRQFAKEMLVPLADPLIAFLDQYWPKRDANGKIRFDPAQSLETWHSAVNPLPEIAGLRFLLPRLLALPAGVTTADQRARWQKMLDELPPVPAAEVNGVKLLRPADSFTSRANTENPELYAVFPYRLYGVGRPGLDVARATYDRRANRHNLGWCQDSIQAACLGLGDEAGRLVAARAAQINSGYRFPAMWGPNFDWIPDQDHGNNILTTLQFMLLQSDGRKLYVLPAWPKDWNVSFKLHAPHETTVEGEVRNGKVISLKVTPESRAEDVVNMLGR